MKKNLFIILALSLLTLSYGCKKDEKKTSSVSTQPKKNLLVTWAYGNQYIAFDTDSYSNYTGTPFSAYFTTNKLQSPAPICRCTITLDGSNTSGTVFVSSCSIVANSSSPTPDCSPITNAFGTIGGTYTNGTVLSLKAYSGSVYYGSWE